MSERASSIEAIWHGDSGFARIVRVALLPLSWLFTAVVALRNRFYDSGRFASERIGCPVVSIGNLSVGGTGKTPVVLWLVEEMLRRGLRPVVVSRGYGRESSGTVALLPDRALEVDAARVVGDEAVLISRRSGVPVVVSERRVDACRSAMAAMQPDLFILDDGFQHRALARDLDIVLLSGAEGGALLPAGPLREPLSSLARAAVVLVSAGAEGLIDSCQKYLPAEAKIQAMTRTSVALVEVVSPDALKTSLDSFVGRKVLAVAGIGQPDGFFQMLEMAGLELVDRMVFPDHAAYTAEDWKQIRGRALAAELVVTTEKDLVKLARFGAEPGFLLALRLGIQIEGAEAVAEQVATLVRRGGRFDPKHG